jgi:hypothetical protein
LNENTIKTVNENSTSFIINNTLVYKSLDEFKNPQAKEIALQLSKLYASLNSHEKLLDILRKQYTTSPSAALRDNILQLELEREQALNAIKQNEKQMRELEQGAIPR